jgi:hypothetical protein
MLVELFYCPPGREKQTGRKRKEKGRREKKERKKEEEHSVRVYNSVLP